MLGCFGASSLVAAHPRDSAPTQPRADAAKFAPPLVPPLVPPLAPPLALPSLGGGTPGGTPPSSSFGGLTFNLGGIKSINRSIDQYKEYVKFFILTIPPISILYNAQKRILKKLKSFSHISIHTVIHNIQHYQKWLQQ